MNDYKKLCEDYFKSQNLTLPPEQQAQFLALSTMYGLNPFKHEIYAVKFGQSLSFTIIVASRVWLAFAASQPNFYKIGVKFYSDNEEVRYFDKSTPKLTAEATVYEMIDGKLFEKNTVSVDLTNDYVQQRRNTFAQNYFRLWAQKVAKKAVVVDTYFDKVFNGVYSDDEMLGLNEQEEPANPTLSKEAAILLHDRLNKDGTKAKEVVKRYCLENKITTKEFTQGKKINLAKLNKVIDNYLGENENEPQISNN